MNRILFAGGGTAGHIEPAWAVSQVWKRRFPGDEIAFLGTKGGQEVELIPDRDGTLFLIPKVIAPRKLNFRTLMFPFQLLNSIAQTVQVVKRFDVVVGFGGYVSASAYIAAWLLRKPVILHDQNAKIGLANILGSKFAKETLLAFPVKTIRGAKVVGNPLKAQIIDAARDSEIDWQKARSEAKIKLQVNGPLVLVLGGSSGSTSINEVISKAKSSGAFDGYTVIHSLGRTNFPTDSANSFENGAKSNYRPVAYIEDMATALLASDLVISRSGAIATTEFAALGKYALFIPLPIGNGEQALNAKELVAAHKAEIIQQSEFTELWLSNNLPRLIKQGTVAAHGTNLNSAELIADAIQRAINGATK